MYSALAAHVTVTHVAHFREVKILVKAIVYYVY